jgi:hypothetical protein
MDLSRQILGWLLLQRRRANGGFNTMAEQAELRLFLAGSRIGTSLREGQGNRRQRERDGQ